MPSQHYPEREKLLGSRAVQSNATPKSDDATGISGSFSSAPIAELYKDTTVLFADIAGFTAWSSSRSPTQVFQLLETIYCAFDAIAKRRRVFKVETIGDSYVAVVGLPSPRDHHAVAMARFAKDIRQKMGLLMAELVTSLGHDTTKLALRIGLNSGPTTAGVLRGEKSRFQLFGDTVNTASRMESNGSPNKIHVSEATADLIRASGKGHWLLPRSTMIDAKGKGAMQTYWCEPTGGADQSIQSSERSVTYHEGDDGIVDATEATETRASVSKLTTIASVSMHDAAPPVFPDLQLTRLIDWNVDLILGMIESIRVSQDGSNTEPVIQGKEDNSEHESVSNVCVLPSLLPLHAIDDDGISTFGPPPVIVQEQLRAFITSIARGPSKGDDSIQRLERCSHVVMTTKKLLDKLLEANPTNANPSTLNTATGRLLADPLTQLALVFAVIIHGLACSNDGPETSVADETWSLLAEPSYNDLRAAMFPNGHKDAQRFRRVLDHATSVTNAPSHAKIQASCDERWQAALWDETDDVMCQLWGGNVVHDVASRRATAVIDLVVQVSQVSHALQHFSIYKKWSMCQWPNMPTTAPAVASAGTGTQDNDSVASWFKRELDWLDTYVLALVQKLQSRQALFGTLGDDYAENALANRVEWERQGWQIVVEAQSARLS